MKVKDILKFFQISSDDETQIKDISDDSSFSSTSWIYLNVSNSKNSEKYTIMLSPAKILATIIIISL